MKNLRKYVENRLDELERLVPDNACLEIDYDDEKDAWYAYYYVEKDECAYPIIINNENVLAFKDIAHDKLVSVLSDIDVFYVP